MGLWDFGERVDEIGLRLSHIAATELAAILLGSMWWIAPVSRHQPLVDVLVLCHPMYSCRTANRDTAEGTAFSLQADTMLCV